MREVDDDAVPVFDPSNKCLGWTDRSVINYYNVHVNLGSNVYRVGEIMLRDRKGYVFERSYFQWIEFSEVPLTIQSAR